MKKCFFLSLLAAFAAFFSPLLPAGRTDPAPEPPPSFAPSEALFTAEPEAPAPSAPTVEIPSRLAVLADGQIGIMALEDYVYGVLAGEMPAAFPEEALKAQAVAARSYALSAAAAHKHGEAAVCTDPNCCQAWQSEEALRERWGADYERWAGKLRAAVAATAGEILCWDGQPVFAAYHSSSAGATEDCGAIWSPRPYLVSVPSPETAEDVPGYVSTVRCWSIDFRDTLLSLRPEADFSGPQSAWLGELTRDASGRVAEAVLGGVSFSGTELRRLFSLRSAAFELRREGGEFVFTVTGSGHGVGMSQYGAKVMAENGADYAEILAHYYPGAVLARGG